MALTHLRATGMPTLFVDFLFLCLLAILLLVNPPTEDTKSEDPPGNLSITLAWDTGSIDVDLWLTGPEESRPVGYSNKSGTHISLLRDDLGTSNDILPVNIENAYSRGLVPGSYIANAHCYRCPSVPVTVQLEIRFSETEGKAARVLLSTTATLTKQGQEITLVQFVLKPDGTVDKSSVHSAFTPLRNAR